MDKTGEGALGSGSEGAVARSLDRGLVGDVAVKVVGVCGVKNLRIEQ